MSTNTVQTTERSLKIFELIVNEEAATVSELASVMDLPKGTVQAHVNTLFDNHYIRKADYGYKGGLKSLAIGGEIACRRDEYYRVRKGVMKLVDRTGERAQFNVEEFGYEYTLCDFVGEDAVRTDVRIGSKTHLHTTSTGKVILAHLPEARRTEIIERLGLPKRTEVTVTDVDELDEELETIRERGYAFNLEERVEKQRAVGVPVFDCDNNVLGGLSISGPASRMTKDCMETEFLNELQGVADAIHLDLVY